MNHSGSKVALKLNRALKVNSMSLLNGGTTSNRTTLDVRFE